MRHSLCNDCSKLKDCVDPCIHVGQLETLSTPQEEPKESRVKRGKYGKDLEVNLRLRVSMPDYKELKLRAFVRQSNVSSLVREAVKNYLASD